MACSRDVAGLETHLAGAAFELGFPHVALVSHSLHRARRGSFVRIENYPAEWVERIEVDPICRMDPVHLAAATSGLGFSWDMLEAIVQLSGDQLRAMDEARRFGLRFGYTIPLRFPGQSMASCSFAAPKAVPLGPEQMMAADWVAAHAYEAALRLQVGPSERPRLSRRQLQCVRLLAAGKTDWEVSRILGIGEETVRTYVKAARAAYGAVTRAQLVALVLRDGIIDAP